MPGYRDIASGLDAPIAEVMRNQAPMRRLAPDPVDDDTVLELLRLGAQAAAGRRRRCEFVIVRDPDVRHQLARTYRQGWSIYKRVLRTRSGDDALLEARQWEADHFEDVPVLIVTCVVGRRPLFPAIGAAAFYASGFAAVQNILLAAGALGLGAAASTLPLWSSWEARRTLGLPAAVTPVAVIPIGWPRGFATPPHVPPVGNVAHLDRWGHQPFRTLQNGQSMTDRARSAALRKA
jgi:nitroreductase